MIEEGDAPPTDISVSCVGRRHKTTTSSEKKHVMQLPTNQSKLLETTKMVLNDLLDESQFFYEKVKADSTASVVQTSRCIPHFGPREIITGRILGTGEFGVVVTVERLELKIAPADYPRHFNQNHIRNERHCDTVAEQNMPPPPSTPTPATINGVENQEEFSLAETLKHHHRAGSSTRMVSFADLGEAAKSVENATQEEVPEIPEPKYFHTRNETLGSASENFISEIKSNIGFPSPRIPPKSIIVLPSNVASMAADTAAGPSLSNVTTHIETTSESSPQMQGSGIISHPYVELKEENEVTETADDKSTYSELSEDVDDNDDDILKDIANKDEHEMVMRSHMALHAHRDGRPRYALKRLRPNLSPKCQIDAAIDLACEGQFLKLLSHSNIIRLRGFVGTPGTVEYALILDCLTQTLSEKLVKWRNKLQSYNGRVFGLFKDKAKIQHSITERLLAAFDIARGLRYLHRKKILYRDLKPDNIGFDVRGDVQIFDFGLAKELKARDQVEPDGYEATGLTGSRRYMSPEVVRCECYGFSADVYSYAILFWEIMALQTPFPKYDVNKHFEYVVIKNKRPYKLKILTKQIHGMMEDAWDRDRSKRPTFKQICQILLAAIQDRTGILNPESVSDRTAFLMNRSLRSMYGGDDRGAGGSSTG